MRKLFYVRFSATFPKKPEERCLNIRSHYIRCLIKATDEESARDVFDELYPDTKALDDSVFDIEYKIDDITNMESFEIDNSYLFS